MPVEAGGAEGSHSSPGDGIIPSSSSSGGLKIDPTGDSPGSPQTPVQGNYLLGSTPLISLDQPVVDQAQIQSAEGASASSGEFHYIVYNTCFILLTISVCHSLGKMKIIRCSFRQNQAKEPHKFTIMIAF